MWVIPLAIPGVVLGALGFVFSMLFQASYVTFYSLMIAFVSIVFLASGEYAWGFAALSFVVLLTGWRLHSSRKSSPAPPDGSPSSKTQG